MSTGQRERVAIQVRFSDVDLAGHVHNAVYLQWFELARMAFLSRFVPRDHDWQAQGIILARNEVDYRMPVHLHDVLEAEAWCSAVGSKRFDLSYTVHRMGGERPGICAEGRSILVCYDYRTGRTMTLPENWRTVLNAGKS